MSDERLEQAIAHWGDRFTVGGVDPADFRKVTSSISSWAEWCGAWSEMAAEHEQLGRQALAESRLRSAGEHLAQAATYYHFAQFVFLDDLEQADAAQASATRCLDDALSHLEPPGRKEKVLFEGATLSGILRLPQRGEAPFPTVLLIPGLDSTKAEFRRVEQSFLDRDVATFSFDGPGQGESRGEMPMRADWESPGGAALDHLAQLPEVDADRIGVWGVSLGGYYAPRLASADSRVKACIALAGPYTFGENNWHELPALTRAAVRHFSGSASDEEAQRFALTLSLAGRADKITCPLLVVFGKQDRLIPWADAARLADEASGPVELLMFDDGNHGCTNILYRHRPYAADWMAAQLGAAEVGRPQGGLASDGRARRRPAEVQLTDLGVIEDFLACALEAHTAVLEYDTVGGQAKARTGVLFHEQQGAAVGTHLADGVEDRLERLRVETHRRLVEDHERRVEHEAPGELDEALLASREAARLVFGPFRHDREQ